MKTLAAICAPVATVAIALLLTAGVRAAADTITWTNTASGGWNTAASWSPNQVPGTNDTVIITNVGVTVSLNGDTGAGAIILGTSGPGTVTLSLAGRTLTLNGPLTVNPSGSFTVDGSTLSGYTNAVLSGTIGWTAGSLAGNLTLSAGGTLNITTGNSHVLANCTVTNNGTVVWSGGEIPAGGIPGTVIYNYGLWDAQNDSTYDNYYGGNGTIFNNFGTFRKSGSAGGNTTLDGGTTFNQLAGKLDCQTNSIVLNGGGNFTGGMATNLAGWVVLNNGTFNINGTVTSTNVQLAGAALTGNNVISGGFNWIVGTWNNSTETIATNTTLLITTGNSHVLENCIVTNNGTVAWSAGEIPSGGPSGTVIYNNGVWDAQSDSTMDTYYGGAGTLFNNFGTFRKSAGTKPNSTTLQGILAFINDGTVDAQNGLMLFSGSFTNSVSTLAVENGATIQIAQAVVLPGGLVTGSGTVQAPSITSSAVINPGATNAVLTLAGNYTQLLGGSMQFDIGGTSPGVNQSQVNVTGTANLDGLIALRFSPGYVPAVNSSNLVLTAGSLNGQFPFQDHFYLLGQNKRINAVYSPTNVVLTTISAADPTNLLLSAAVQDQTFALAWPSEFGNYNLEMKTNLTDPTWTIIPGVTNFYTETPPASPHKFFRLFQAP